MAWPSASCGTTSEFVELMNFGPGPVNIGCYILTTGVYSVTIPPNTILKAGQYYVISGQDIISGSCSNVDSTTTGIHASLNWNTCNCTNKPIPKTGDGMMTDGGPGNTPLVLFDPALNVVDAITRDLPTEPSVPVTTSAVGGCASKTFNLGTMNIPYETMGMAAGKQNSFARTLDGDCNWQKTPQQSGNSSNNKPGNTTDISYEFDMVNPTSCDESGTGSVSIYVKHSNYASIFPMSYTISLDTNKDGLFDFNDQYTTYTDSTPPFIEIDNLPVGHFRVTVFSIKGCYLKNYDFNIIPCNPSTLPVKLVYFTHAGTTNQQLQLDWLLQEVQNLQSTVVEKSADGITFLPEKIMVNEKDRGPKLYSASVPRQAPFFYYRLKITQKSGQSFYSPIIKTTTGAPAGTNRVWPNPATDRLYVELSVPENQRLPYTIYNANGVAVCNGQLQLTNGSNAGSIFLPSSLRAGVYQLQLNGRQPISFRFVKH